MNHCLVHKFGFKGNDDILMLNEDQLNPHQIPTRRNILMAIQWLVSDLREGDANSLVFMYSGHGDQVRDYQGEELDGKCETILPLDFRAAGPILDKELHHLLIQPLPSGTRLHALVDACHSGTILDLPYQCTPEQGQTQWGGSYWVPAQRVFKGTAGGLAICISGCRDDQTSADTAKLSQGATTTGAMLYSFIQAVEQNRARTYGELLFSMRQIIEHALQHGLGWGNIATLGAVALFSGLETAALVAAPTLATQFMGSGVQVPQMSSSVCFDLNAPFDL